jgi:predicted ABC-type ATPase
VNPVLLVIAGPNGAGKTTVTGRLREDHWSDGLEYLNPDEIARDRFGDWNSPEAVLEAARWTEARREELMAAGKGIAFETVFSSPGKVDFIARAKALGYFVRSRLPLRQLRGRSRGQALFADARGIDPQDLRTAS